ncbi:MAG: branched-chain amino acid transport system II carrier protein [Chthoniobacterales bacterium]
MEIRKVLTTGVAMFAMLFGAGNVVFPLMVGRDTGHQLLFGLAGFIITAVFVPLMGLFSTMLSHGDYKGLLAPLGKIPTFFITIICMILIGPFAITPRCITLSYAAIKEQLPSLSLVSFSILCAVIIFFCTIKNSFVMDLLGKFLGPLKIILLTTIIAKGLFAPVMALPIVMTKTEAFSKGLFSGYGTCDLLATIFLSGLILSGLRRGMDSEKQKDPRYIIKWGLQAMMIGGVLLGLVYAGFCIIAGSFGQQLATRDSADLFASLAVLVLGEKGGLLANATIAISCLTTAIALTAVFAMYLHKDLSGGRLNYPIALLITILITAFVTTFGFSGIMSAIGPIIKIIYPILIIYTLFNIVRKLWKIERHEPVSLVMVQESSDWEE